jgi:cold shock CspA family protein
MAYAGDGPRAPRTGVVIAFDEPRGLGVVRGDDGRNYPFHCTALADGTREVALGTRVVFSLAAGHGGRYEARAVTTVPPG